MSNRKTIPSIRLLPIIALMILIVMSGTHVYGVTETAASTANSTLSFSDSGISVSGSTEGVEISGTDLKIAQSGTYVLMGSCTEGSVTVKKDVTDVVLILQDFQLRSSASAPITCNKNSDTTIILEGNSTLTDAENPANENSVDADVADAFDGAAIKVKSGGSLTIQGSGTLLADGSQCKNGIKGASTASVTIESGTVQVKAAKNGIASDGSITIHGGSISVTAGNDGIKSEADDDDADSPATVSIDGGNITVVSGGDGIQAGGNLTITGGTFDLTCGGGYTASLDDDDSAKGLKSDQDITITQGSFQINAADDAVHSNNHVTITGGDFMIYSGDDGIHADYTLTLGAKNASGGPAIQIVRSYEGLEGAIIYMYGGSGNVVASDDGINAANSDLRGYSFLLQIEDGSWMVNAGGDGLDSNGDIVVNGGTTYVFGAAQSGDGALDFDGTCTVNDGQLLCIGMSGMAMTPTTGTYVTFGASGMGGGRGGMGGNMGGRQFGNMGQRPTDMNGQQPAGQIMEPVTNDTSTGSVSLVSGDTVEIKDASGNTLCSTTAVKNANHMMYSSGNLVSGETYTLYVNGAVAATNTAATGSGGSGGFPGGGNENGEPVPPTDLPEPIHGGEMPPSDIPGTDPSSNPNPFGFQDVSPDAWYANAVAYVQSRGYMVGTSSTQFAPETPLTRAMLVQILYNMEGTPTASQASSYTDVTQNAWYANAVAWAQQNDIVQGFGAGIFAPENLLTREQAATILYRYARYKQLDVTAEKNLSVYQDASSVSDWAVSCMKWAVGSSIINGTSATTLTPSGTATRAQMAQIIQNYVTAYAL